MKSIIIYESTHHGNTKKLVDAIAAKYFFSIPVGIQAPGM